MGLYDDIKNQKPFLLGGEKPITEEEARQFLIEAYNDWLTTPSNESTPVVVWVPTPKSKSFIIDGKKRIIRKISYSSENDFYATYKGHNITICAQETGGWTAMAQCIETGMYAVDTEVGGDRFDEYDSLDSVIKMVIKNILI